MFKEKLPYDLAPTFRGQFAKYSYKLTIGVQKLNGSTQLLRLPFRVYSLLDFEKFIPKLERLDSQAISNEAAVVAVTDDIGEDTESPEDDDRAVPNPFEVVEKSEYENLEYALQILEDLTARMNTSNAKRYTFQKNARKHQYFFLL